MIKFSRHALKSALPKGRLIKQIVGGLSPAASFFISSRYPQLAPFMMIGGTGALFTLALYTSFEFFLCVATASLFSVCLSPPHPLLILGYGGYIFLPCFMLSLYKKIALSRGNRQDSLAPPSIFHVLISFFSLMAFALSWVWPFVLKPLAPPLRFLLFLPGLLALVIGTLMCMTLSWSASKTHYPLNQKSSFSIHPFHYWWIILCQVSILFSQGLDRIFFSNLLAASLLPFAVSGWQKFVCSHFHKNHFWLTLGASFLGVCLIVPLGGLILYTLFEPWARQKDNYGNR